MTLPLPSFNGLYAPPRWLGIDRESKLSINGRMGYTGRTTDAEPLKDATVVDDEKSGPAAERIWHEAIIMAPTHNSRFMIFSFFIVMGGSLQTQE